MVCVFCYFIMSAILTWHTSAVEQGIFATVLDVDPSGIDPNNSWSAASTLKRYCVSALNGNKSFIFKLKDIVTTQMYNSQYLQYYFEVLRLQRCLFNIM